MCGHMLVVARGRHKLLSLLQVLMLGAKTSDQALHKQKKRLKTRSKRIEPQIYF